MMESKFDELKNSLRWRVGEVQRRSLQENGWDHLNKQDAVAARHIIKTFQWRFD